MAMALVAHAYTCVDLRSGDPSVFLQNAKTSFEMDWDHARVTNWENVLWPQYLQKRGEDFVRDWQNDRKTVEVGFASEFNRKNNYLQIPLDGSAIQYRMIFRIATIDVGNGSGLFTPFGSAKAGGVIINGTIEMRDITGKLLCVLNVDEGKGLGHMSETVRMSRAMYQIAGDLKDFIKAVKKGKVVATPVEADIFGSNGTTQIIGLPIQNLDAQTQQIASQPLDTQYPIAANATDAQPNVTMHQPIVTGNSEAKVTLKNGSVINGKIKALNPTKSITIVVDGIETEIPMSEVESVASSEGAVLDVSERTSYSEQSSTEATSQMAVVEAQNQTQGSVETTKSSTDSRVRSTKSSRYPSFNVHVKYMGEWHAGYGCSSRVNGWNTYTAKAETGFLQGVSLNDYIQLGVGVDGVMYTHYYKGQDMRWAVTPYGVLRGLFPISEVFAPLVHLALGTEVMVAPDAGGHSFFCEFGPGFRYKKFNFFCGLQHVGKGKGSNHFFAKLGWYF